MSAAVRLGDRDPEALRVGVVGLGTWGREHVRAWQNLLGAEVVAVCDQSATVAEAVANELGGALWFTDADAMASATALDAVSVVTDERTHLEVCVPFISASVPLLVEKPIAISLADATELLDRAEAGGVLVMPGHLLRFDPRLCLLRERVALGELGELRSITARRHMPRHRHAKYARTHPALATAIHDLDLLRWFFDSTPVSVHCWSQRANADSAPDLVWCRVEFEHGEVGLTETGWLLPERAGIWVDSAVQVIGSKGVASVKSPGDALTIYRDDGVEVPDTSVLSYSAKASAGILRDELAYFAGCVRSGTPPSRIDLRDGLKTLELALAAVESESRGCTVELA